MKSRFQQNQKPDYSTSENPYSLDLMDKSVQAIHHRTSQSIQHKLFAITDYRLQAPYKVVENYHANEEFQ